MKPLAANKAGRRSTALLAALWVSVASLAVTGLGRAQEVPLPNLDDVETRVRDKVLHHYNQVQSQGRSADSWGRYGMVLDAHRFQAAARVAYQKAHGLDPQEFRWPYYLATLTELMEPHTAMEWYQRALRLDPRYAPAQVRVGETLEKLGRLDEARRHYKRAAELDPAEALAPFGLGRIALGRGEIEDALGHLERAYELDRRTQAIAATLARAYQRAGRTELARRRAAEARHLVPMTHHRDERRAAVGREAVDVMSYLRRSRTYREVGQLTSALRELEALLAHEPGNVEAHLAAAGVHDLMGDPQATLEAAQAAQKLAPDLAGVHAALAGAFFKLRRFAEAESHARRVLQQTPRDVHMRLLLAMTAAQKGRTEEMIGHLDEAYEARTQAPGLRPLLIQLLLDLGESFAAVGRYEEAVRKMEQVLTLAREAGDPPAETEPHRRRLEAYRARWQR